MDFQKYIKRLSRFKSLTTIEIGFPTNGNMLLDLPKDFDDKFWTGQQLQMWTTLLQSFSKCTFKSSTVLYPVLPQSEGQGIVKPPHSFCACFMR